MEGQRVLLFSRKDLVYTIILWLTSNKYYVYYVWHAPLINTISIRRRNSKRIKHEAIPRLRTSSK